MTGRISDTPEYRSKRRQWIAVAIVLAVFVVVVVGVVAHDAGQRERDRIVVRYVLCRENDAIKVVLRDDLRESIKQGEAFLRENPAGIPGISDTLIRRSIERDRRQLRSLAPKDCVAFARDPADLNVQVPPLPEEATR